MEEEQQKQYEEAQQMQREEIEGLHSVYAGDQNFKQLDDITYQYKIEQNGKSFIIEVMWGINYPKEKPLINLDIFYNEHLKPSAREKIMSIVDKEAEEWIGGAVTYTIIEALKDKFDEIMNDQVEEGLASKIQKMSFSDRV